MLEAKQAVVPQELLLVGAALKVGIFAALHERVVGEAALARELQLNERAVRTVLSPLLALGYIRQTADGFTLTAETAERFFKEDSVDFIGYGLIHTLQVIEAWTHLPEVLKSGRPWERMRGEAEIHGFMAAMKRNARPFAADLANRCLQGLPPTAKVLDLGGGPLNYARPFAAAGAAVTVQDMPEVCRVMAAEVREGETITFVPGSFLAGLPSGVFDVVFLGNICHIYGEAELRQLFKRVHAVLTPGGRIAILDFVRGRSPRAALFAVNMLVNTENGGTWTEAEYDDWLRTAGFTSLAITDMDERQLLLAQKA